MSDNVDYKSLALEAIDGMPPNGKRTAHYSDFEHSHIRLVNEIFKLPEVRTVALNTNTFRNFSVTIELNSTNC